MRIMIEEDLPQEKSKPHVPPLNHPRSTNSGPYDRPIGNTKQGSSCEVCQQTIGEWGYYFPLWKLLSKAHGEQLYHKYFTTNSF